MQYCKKRIEWVDYLKAFACLLVVLGHLIQSLQKAELDGFENITGFIERSIYLFHMPLFMCMSGFLYNRTRKDFTAKSYGVFVLKKTINLGVPYFTFYCIFLSLNILFSSSVNTARSKSDFLSMFNNPMPPYWFLYALLSIFICVPLIEKIFNNNKYITLAFLAGLKIISLFSLTPVYFINSVMSYGLYFYIGCFINDDKQTSLPKCVAGATVWSIASVLLYLYRDGIEAHLLAFIKIIFAITAIIILTQIFRRIKKSAVLDTFKKYTFQIFVMHTIFAAGIRILLLKAGVENYAVHFIAGIIFSVYAPVIVSMISDKIVYTNFFFYPLKTTEQIKKGKVK